MSKKPSLVHEVLRALDSLEAYGVSRHKLKAEQREALRAAGKPVHWAHSTGKIHSFKTKQVYKEHCLNFARWARERHGLKRLGHLGERLDVLAVEWLRERLAAGVSPDTAQVARSALRMLARAVGWEEDRVRQLAADVPIPVRHREAIRRSRGAVRADHEFQHENWRELIDFARATGLRRHELAAVRVEDILATEAGLHVHVRRGKGGKERYVPVLPGHEEAVLAAIRGRSPQERVWPRIPVRLDVHAYRREYAQALYRHLSGGRELPPSRGRLRPQDYDRAAAAAVSRALGHSRVDVVSRHYLR